MYKGCLLSLSSLVCRCLLFDFFLPPRSSFLLLSRYMLLLRCSVQPVERQGRVGLGVHLSHTYSRSASGKLSLRQVPPLTFTLAPPLLSTQHPLTSKDVVLYDPSPVGLVRLVSPSSTNEHPELT